MNFEAQDISMLLNIDATEKELFFANLQSLLGSRANVSGFQNIVLLSKSFVGNPYFLKTCFTPLILSLLEIV